MLTGEGSQLIGTNTLTMFATEKGLEAWQGVERCTRQRMKGVSVSSRDSSLPPHRSQQSVYCIHRSTGDWTTIVTGLPYSSVEYTSP